LERFQNRTDHALPKPANSRAPYTIAPGRLLTPMTAPMLSDPATYQAGLARIPAGRYGDPAEIARLAVFLASDAAAYIVGETIIADGGYVLG
jgi:NAD(P)-dependent dehydrogenase (short-subunit alcohol dehydrogenase family)